VISGWQLTIPQVSEKVLRDPGKPPVRSGDNEFALPGGSTIERLNELATAKLSEIVRRSTAQDRGWRGYSEAEIAAARELLSGDASASSAIKR
jgi:hypothetical protein